MSNSPTLQTDDKPNEFAASGGSPPPVAMPPRLVEELAEILAAALEQDLQQYPESRQGKMPDIGGTAAASSRPPAVR